MANDIRYRAAWVPDDDEERDWESAAALAADWISREAQELGASPLLVTYSYSNGQSIRPLAGMEQITTRSQRHARRGRPVLAYVPDERTLDLAHDFARGHALCVVETVSFPVRGWARATGALDLISGQVTSPFEPEALKELEHLNFLGNNGWGDQHGKQRARATLPRVLTLVEPAEVLGYMVAMGRGARAIGHLRSHIETVNPYAFNED